MSLFPIHIGPPSLPHPPLPNPQQETDHEHGFLGVPASTRAPHSDEEHTREPNVLVAHTRHGIEAVHLWSGQPLCHLHLSDRGLWHDLNGDGILDVAHGVGAVAGGEEGEGRLAGRGTRRSHTRLPSCYARVSAAAGCMGSQPKAAALTHPPRDRRLQVMTGVPPTEPLFNGSLCSPSTGVPTFDTATHFGGPLAGEGGEGGDVEVAVPIALDRPTSLSGTVHSRVQHARRAVHPHDALFLTSRGTVTSYGPHGELNWQTATPARWDVHPEWEEVGWQQHVCV